MWTVTDFECGALVAIIIRSFLPWHLAHATSESISIVLCRSNKSGPQKESSGPKKACYHYYQSSHCRDSGVLVSICFCKNLYHLIGQEFFFVNYLLPPPSTCCLMRFGQLHMPRVVVLEKYKFVLLTPIMFITDINCHCVYVLVIHFSVFLVCTVFFCCCFCHWVETKRHWIYVLFTYLSVFIIFSV